MARLTDVADPLAPARTASARSASRVWVRPSAVSEAMLVIERCPNHPEWPGCRGLCWRGHSHRRGKACAKSLSSRPKALPGRALDHPGKAGRREWKTAFTDEDKRATACSRAAGGAAPAAHRRAAGACWRPVLGPPDVTQHAVEVYLLPAQVTQLGGTQAMPEGDQDHGSVPISVSVGLGSLDQRLDFATRVS